MKRYRPRQQRRGPLGSFARYIVEPLERRMLLAAVFWDGGAADGLWNSPNNWSNNAVPTAADDVTIDLAGTYTVTLSGTAASVNSLNLGAASGTQTLAINVDLTLASASAVAANGVVQLNDQGSLGGAGNLTVNGSIVWTGGAMIGSGATIIASTGVFNLSGSEPKQLMRSIENNGSTQWTEGTIGFFDGNFNNNGTFTADSSGALDCVGSGLNNLFQNNAGATFTKLGSGSMQFFADEIDAVSFDNDGIVNVSAGTLTVNAGASHSGDFTVTGGALLEFAGGGSQSFSAAADISGGGDLTISSPLNHDGTVNITGNAAISGDPVAFNGTAAFNAGTLSGGTLTGSGIVTFNGTLDWTGGTMSGAGTTIIANGATLNLSGSGTKALHRVLDNNGMANWTQGEWNFSGGGTFNNNSGTMTIIASGMQQSGGGTINNAGMLIKQGSAALNFTIALNNSGTVDVQTGMLNLGGGGTHTNDFMVAASAGLAVSGTHSFSAASDITGAGDLTISGILTDDGTVNITGSVNISGGPVAFNGAATFNSGTFSNGTLTGSGTVTFNGTLNWTDTFTNGTMSGSGTTIISSTGVLNMTAGPVRFVARIIQNDGVTNWTGAQIRSDGGRFDNNGSFIVNSAASLSWLAVSGVNVFNNSGTFTKMGAGTTSFSRLNPSSTPMAFNNSGTVNIQAGTLSLGTDGTHTNDFMVSGGALLEFAFVFGSGSGSHSFSATSDITGAGNLRFTGNGTSTHDGTVNIGGTATFNADSTSTVTFTNSFTGGSGLVVGVSSAIATVNFNGPTSFPATATMTLGSAGTANMGSSSHTFATYTQSAGTLTGSGSLTVTGTLNWAGGRMSGSGTTIIPPTGTLNVTSPNLPPFSSLHFLERIVQNDGTANWTGGEVRCQDSGRLDNNGSFTAIPPASEVLRWNGGAAANPFNNAGTFTKLGFQTTEFTAFVPFNNSGLLDAQDGTLRLHFGGTHGSMFTIGAGAILSLSGTHAFSDTSSISGAGTLGVVGGSSAGLGTIDVGTVQLSAGSLLGFAAGASQTMRTTSLSITAGARLDLANDALVVDYTGTSPLATIRSLLTTGYANGAWNGVGINSSVAASTAGRAVGYAEASAIFSSFPAIFAGQMVDDTSVLVRYTRYGDANLNQITNLDDFNRLAANFGASNTVWSQGNFNYDNVTNLNDFNLLAANFGQAASVPMRGVLIPPRVVESVFAKDAEDVLV